MKPGPDRFALSWGRWFRTDPAGSPGHSMRIFLTGGTGLIGRSLVQRLRARGDQPVILSRRADDARRDPALQGCELVAGDPTRPGPWQNAVDGCDAVINLVGQNLFARRWSPAFKQSIRDSRVLGTQAVVAAITQAKRPPRTLVQASATGYYGPHGDEELTEASPPGSDYLAKVCVEWEQAAEAARVHGLRVVPVRTGVVLAQGEGALGVMTPIFKWLPGGAAPVGNGGSLLMPATGQQWLSWIHLDDIVGLFLLGLDDDRATGPLNGTAPHPARNVDFSRALAKVVHRPFLPIGPPDALLKLVLGEVAGVVTQGQRVLPAAALGLGYRFEHPDLLAALQSIFRPSGASAPPPAPAAGASAR